MPVPARVSLVTLGVRDVAAATAFYERLGWHRSEASQEGISFFQLGTSGLALYGVHELAKDARVGAAEAEAVERSRFRGATLAINVPQREDVDAVLREAEGAGAGIAKPAEDAFWGGRSGYFSDPDGHLWEVAWNPFFPLGPDGSLKLP